MVILLFRAVLEKFCGKVILLKCLILKLLQLKIPHSLSLWHL